MIAMDLKGITWVGHAYQKFETLCLEAEEVMYQDTVKYVEDQVHTVGASVKKFYSDVMQDLLLPSSLEPVEAVTASDAPVEKNSVTLKTPIVGLMDAAIKSKGAQLTEHSEVIVEVNENAADVPSSCRLHVDANVFESRHGRFVERESSDLLSGDHGYNVLDKPNVENLPLARTSSESVSVENEFSRMPSFSENANANHEVPCQQLPTSLTQGSVEEGGCDSLEESCNEIESASESALGIPNDDLQLVESVADKEIEIRFSSYVIGSAESNGQSTNWTMSTSAERSTTATTGSKEIETAQPLGNTPIDESCIMVNGAELHFHHQKAGKHKPYQKKFRDAISLRMRSARKNEYKQLALRHGEDIKSDQDCKGSSQSALTKEDARRSQTPDIMDSEWELL